MLITTHWSVGSVAVDGGGQIACPQCSACFKSRRRDQRYCAKPCAKAATRNASRGSREIENTRRNVTHYQRASWLSCDVLRLRPERQRQMLLSILQAASGDDAPLRNIVLHPALLGAAWGSSIGKFYPDTHDYSAPNIAKMVDAFCREELGCGVRDAILDNGKPAHRYLTEAEEPDAPPQHDETHWQTLRKAGTLDRPIHDGTLRTSGYDWRLLARAMGERRWRRYFTTDDLDLFL